MTFAFKTGSKIRSSVKKLFMIEKLANNQEN